MIFLPILTSTVSRWIRCVCGVCGRVCGVCAAPCVGGAYVVASPCAVLWYTGRAPVETAFNIYRLIHIVFTIYFDVSSYLRIHTHTHTHTHSVTTVSWVDTQRKHGLRSLNTRTSTSSPTTPSTFLTASYGIHAHTHTHTHTHTPTCMYLHACILPIPCIA